LSEEQKAGADYAKKPEVERPAKKVNTTLNSFFVSTDKAFEEEEEPVVVAQKPKEDQLPPMDEEVDLENPDTSFRIHLSIDDEDEDAFAYGSFDDHLPKPEPTVIPSYASERVKEPRREDIPERPREVHKPAPVAPVVEEIQEIDQFSYGDEAEEEAPYVAKEEPVSVPVEPVVNVEKPAPAPKPVNRYAKYKIPYQELFPKSESSEDEIPAWLEEKKDIINQCLISFGIDGEVINYTKGPAFTRYEIMLAANVNVKKINGIYDNIQMALKATSLRIQAPIPGKNTVGIEVPNDVADVVKFGDILTDSYISSDKNLMIAMGKNIDGTPVFQNIIDMPHALIAGATKSGKSVCINTLLVSLLIKNSPEQLKLILVDPKKVELSFYNNLPHLATPVIDDAIIATEALKWSVDEMERRYELLAQCRVRNIEDYNRKRQNHPEMENLPFIVIVVDEFNDLVMQCGVEANDAIIRLAQKARAAGLHIILATQRPTVNVVNGTIKSNITCRIAFRVASDQDSRIILDEQGAESLLGRGDMLIRNNGLPERVQGAYISDDEISSICDYICDNYEPDFLFTHDDLRKKAMKQGGGSFGGKDSPQESDDMLYQIALYCIESGMCSINSIQQNFGIGFNRASRIVSILEERNIVSPKNGTKGREILVDSYQLKQMFDEIM
ncbi:MAG: DNA translocase FtsK, partial [Anaeroplasmataceae bacterium]|nr:DNA translocase FtsK [Anaeroplasmataceae bacterium]